MTEARDHATPQPGPDGAPNRPQTAADVDLDDGPEAAARFGMTAGDEPFDADHHGVSVPVRDEMEQRVLEALRSDASTAGLADRVEFDVEGGVVRIIGVVDDLDDEDAILEVIESVPGVRIVDSRITIATVEEASLDRA